MLEKGDRIGKKERKEFSRKSKILARQQENLFFKGKILMRKTKKWQQIVTPGVLKKTVFEELHVNLGHIGSEKVLDLARQRFYWPNMSQDIEFFVRKQCRCMIAKKTNIADRAPLVPVEATYPFEIISIDFFTFRQIKWRTRIRIGCV